MHFKTGSKTCTCLGKESRHLAHSHMNSFCAGYKTVREGIKEKARLEQVYNHARQQWPPTHYQIKESKSPSQKGNNQRGHDVRHPFVKYHVDFFFKNEINTNCTISE